MPVASAQVLRSTVSPASKAKDTVKVGPKAMLNAIVAEIGLSEAGYKTYACHRGLVGAIVYFWPSLDPTKIHGQPAANIDEAMQSAATECLEHLAGTMEVEFDCPQVKKMKNEMKRLLGNIDDRDRKTRTLKKGWGSYADDIYGSGNRIGKVVVNYLPSSSSPIVSDVACDFYGVSQEAENLNHISLMATDAIRTIGIYPYDAESDCSEYDEFPGYCSSNYTEDDCSARRFDDEDFLYDDNA